MASAGAMPWELRGRSSPLRGSRSGWKSSSLSNSSVRHCRLFPQKLPMCDRDFGILPGFIARCQARFALIGPTGRAVLLKIKFTHLHKRSWPCVLRRRNASTPPTTHSPTTRSVFRRSHSAAQRVLSFSDGISLFFPRWLINTYSCGLPTELIIKLTKLVKWLW